MDATMTQKVKNTVLDLVGRGFMFTAFDVTKVLRNDGDRVRHGDVNQAIQQMFTDNELGMYTRDTVNVGAPVQPWVYYHPYSDVANYRQDWVEANPDQTGMRHADGSATDDGDSNLSTNAVPPVGTVAHVQAAPSAPVTPSTTPPVAVAPGVTVGKVDASVTRSMSSANRVYLPQNEGRLNIPPVLVRQIAKSGDMIRVDCTIDYSAPANHQKRLVIAPASSGGRMDYMVNKDGRIRLSRSATAYLNGSGQYEIKLENGNLVVAAI